MRTFVTDVGSWFYCKFKNKNRVPLNPTTLVGLSFPYRCTILSKAEARPFWVFAEIACGELGSAGLDADDHSR
jgi:hypothetical protein